MTFSIMDSWGIYHCPSCGWKRPDPDYSAENITMREDGLYSFDLDGQHIDSTARTPYNIYNTLSAYTALKTAGGEGIKNLRP